MIIIIDLNNNNHRFSFPLHSDRKYSVWAEINDMLYELCLSDDDEEDEDMHVHFYCERCHRTYCLNDIHVPQVDLPAGYEQSSINYMIKGVCPKCTHRYYIK